MTQHAAQQQALAACEQGAMCIDDRPGHAVTLMHLRLAHLHPEGWVDAVVEGVQEDGTVTLRRWSDGTATQVWHHIDRRDLLAPGSVVSVHERYGVLAAGEHRLNVAQR
jgi:hypothetical protein